VVKLTQKQADLMDGLTPMGIQRLRSLRRENTALRARIVTLEQDLEKERIEHHVDVEVWIASHGHSAAAAQSISRSPPEQEDDSEPTGPGSGAGPPPAPHGGQRAIRGLRDARRREQLKKAAGSVLFYLALALALVAAVFIRAARKGAPVSIAGYSGMLVLTESMQDAIPKGSFILTKHTEPEDLQIGDDITFMVNPTTSVTHRIVDIRPQAGGTPIIQTKGVNNPTPDTPVPVENIVGKVVYHSLFLGLLAKGISDNWPLLLFLLAVWAVLGKVLFRLFRGGGPSQGRRVCKTVPGEARRTQAQQTKF